MRSTAGCSPHLVLAYDAARAYIASAHRPLFQLLPRMSVRASSILSLPRIRNGHDIDANTQEASALLTAVHSQR